MNWATAVVIIVALICLAEVLKARLGAQQGTTTAEDGKDKLIKDQSKREVEELRERVKVLERIVTDGGYGVGHEIERLRDDGEKVR